MFSDTNLPNNQIQTNGFCCCLNVQYIINLTNKSYKYTYLSHQPISSMYHMPLTGIPPFWGSQSQLHVYKQTSKTTLTNVISDVSRASLQKRP